MNESKRNKQTAAFSRVNGFNSTVLTMIPAYEIKLAEVLDDVETFGVYATTERLTTLSEEFVSLLVDVMDRHGKLDQIVDDRIIERDLDAIDDNDDDDEDEIENEFDDETDELENEINAAIEAESSKPIADVVGVVDRVEYTH